ncbi:unnamed protein product, partial [Prorocentrum cordatum]
EIVSVEHLLSSPPPNFIFQQGSEPSPDVFFLHPAVHNCHAVEYLFSGSAFKPKVLVIPINPLVPPPFEVTPRFEAWWHSLRPALRSVPLARRWFQHGQEEGGGGGAGRRGGRARRAGRLPVARLLAGPVLAGGGGRAAGAPGQEALQVLAAPPRGRLRGVRARGPAECPGAGARGAQAGQLLAGRVVLRAGQPPIIFARLELAAGASVVKLADPDVPSGEKEAILCGLLEDHRVPVLKRNFDCMGFRGSDGWAGADGPGAATGSCVSHDHRGWGNDAAVFDSIQRSPRACQARCAASNCSYWTFDPTAMYGSQLCWVWIGGRPAEVKFEKGWVSGDAECSAALSSGPEDARAASAPAQAAPDSSPARAEVRGPGGAPAEGRELFKLWAVEQAQEMPGMRFFLEAGSRGRCVRGFCECFPPYRGPLCEQLDSGPRDASRNFSGVLHYLTSDDEDDVQDIRHSLPRLWERFNGRFDYPVVIFHDGLSEEHRRQIVRASENRVWFAYVDDYLSVPEMITEDPVRRARLDEVKWSLGYRGMCRFRSGTIFLQPALRNFQYAMTLDTDGYFPAEVVSDPIAAMHEGGYVYTFSHLLPDLPSAVKHFWDYTLLYMRMKGINPRGTPILEQFVREDDLQWNYQLYMNDIEIVQLDWFRSEPYQDYFRYLDSVGGFWLHRWGDHAVRTIAVGMWLPEDKVYEMDVPYGHQNYCKCSGAHPDLECVREGDVGGEPAKWWICTSEAHPLLDLSSLAYSNLGGAGPDADAGTPEIVYSKALDGGATDLRISAQGIHNNEGTAGSSRNVNSGAGRQIGTVNLRRGSNADLHFRFVKAHAHSTPARVPQTYVTMFIPDDGVESVSVTQYQEFCFPSSSVVRQGKGAGGREMFFAAGSPFQAAGRLGAPPSDASRLKPDEEARAVTFLFEEA